MKYQLFIERSAQKELSKIPQQDQTRIIAAIQGLSDDPRPSGVKKLSAGVLGVFELVTIG